MIRIGAPEYLSARPLIYGLTQKQYESVELVYDLPAQLAEALEQGRLDAALIPSIEFLRGVGRHYIDGPARIATGATRSLILVSEKPPESIRRIAVAESCRTPLVVLRIVLDRLHGNQPDICVLKSDLENWREGHDAVLLTGDRGLDCVVRNRFAPACYYDLADMWRSLFAEPLVLSLWAYNDHRLTERLRSLVTQSCEFGLDNLSRLAKGLAQTSGFDTAFLLSYLSEGWAYDIGCDDNGGLRLLEDYALEYQLIQERRVERILAG